MKHLKVSILLWVCLFINTCSTHSLQNVTALRKHLFESKTHDRYTRPQHNQSIPTTVTMDLAIYAIFDLDEVAQILKFAGCLQLQWIDETLIWNPSDFGGVESALYPQNAVWRPDVVLKNSVIDYKAIGDSSLNVVVHSDGRVVWHPYQVFSSLCLVDITFFPYDRQTCEIVFITWGYNKEDIVIKGPTSGSAVNLDFMVPNSEWNIENVECRTTLNPKPMMIFNLTMSRKPQHVMSSIVLPLMVLCILNICVFVLPSSSGEKASYAVTVFLSFVVFSTIVQSTLPANSDCTSYLEMLINFLVFQSAVITFLALCCIRLSGKSTPVPAWVKYLCCLRTKNHIKYNCSPTMGDESNYTDSVIQSINGQMLNRHRSTVTSYKEKLLNDENETDDDTEKHTVTWERVVNVADTVIFTMLMILNLFITITFFVITL